MSHISPVSAPKPVFRSSAPIPIPTFIPTFTPTVSPSFLVCKSNADCASLFYQSASGKSSNCGTISLTNPLINKGNPDLNVGLCNGGQCGYFSSLSQFNQCK